AQEFAPEAPRTIREQLRRATYRPEQQRDYAALGASAREVAERQAAEKRRWGQLAQTPDNAAARHRGIAAANAALRELAAPQRRALEQSLAEAELRQRAARVLNSREYAFCLFPRRYLEQFLLDLGCNAR
ncbi:MAG TPA: hypothetical protein PKC18_20870, partial [Lacipirellulaceae bacterium]|nr:hypothetical protein [Lacipirellulaceae bacterium]